MEFRDNNDYQPSKICWAHIDYGDSNCRVSAQNRFCEHCKPGDYTCQLNCPTYSRCKHTFEVGGFPNRFWDIPANIQSPPEDYTSLITLSAIRRDILGFVNCGQNITIHSNVVSSGKTFQACLFAQTYIFRQSNTNYHTGLAYYVYLPSWIAKYDIYDKLQKDDERRIVFYDSLDQLSKADLVIWDGLGFNSGSRLEDLVIRAIIQSRLNDKFSNIFIPYGNLSDFNSYLVESDLTRIRDNSIEIELSGMSFSAHQRDDYIMKVNDSITKLSRER